MGGSRETTEVGTAREETLGYPSRTAINELSDLKTSLDQMSLMANMDKAYTLGGRELTDIKSTADKIGNTLSGIMLAMDDELTEEQSIAYSEALNNLDILQEDLDRLEGLSGREAQNMIAYITNDLTRYQELLRR